MSQTPKLNMFPIGPATGKSGAAPGWAIIGIFVILMFAALIAARDFLMPVVTALLLFMMFIPLRRHLERWHISARVTAGLVVVLMLAVMILLLGALRGPVTQVFDNLPEIGRHLETKFEGVFTAMRDLEKAVEESLPAKPQAATDAPEPVPAPSRLSLRDVQITEVLSYLLAAPAIVGQMLFTLVLL
ncbi:MAG: AI-2E family transporter, partial [Paracoccaceae bacterium]|nr:AI-2E family transporter [Paracoccaceae bacterium]